MYLQKVQFEDLKVFVVLKLFLCFWFDLTILKYKDDKQDNMLDIAPKVDRMAEAHYLCILNASRD